MKINVLVHQSNSHRCSILPFFRLDSDRTLKPRLLFAAEHARCHGDYSNKEGLKIKTSIPTFLTGLFLHSLHLFKVDLKHVNKAPEALAGSEPFPSSNCCASRSASFKSSWQQCSQHSLRRLACSATWWHLFTINQNIFFLQEPHTTLKFNVNRKSSCCMILCFLLKCCLMLNSLQRKSAWPHGENIQICKDLNLVHL